MSLGVVVKGAEGIVFGADTRLTLRMKDPAFVDTTIVHFDNASKILSFDPPHNFVGAVTYGQANLLGLPIREYSSMLETVFGNARLSTEEYAKRLSNFLGTLWKQSSGIEGSQSDGIEFILGGYNEGELHGEIYRFNVPHRPDPVQVHPGSQCGMSWGGQWRITQRIINGFDSDLAGKLAKELNMPPGDVAAILQKLVPELAYRIPYDALPLQDCINLAAFVVRTTITAQSFVQAPIRGVGGYVELATITGRGGFEWIQKNELHGER